MTFSTSFSKALGKAAGLGIRILPAPLCCEGVVARDIIFPFFLQKTDQDVSRKPDGECLLRKWQGRPGERKQGLSEERLPK